MIDKELKEVISEKFFDLGNLFVAGWSIGTLISSMKLKWLFFISGFLAAIIIYFLGIIIRKSGGN